MRHSLLLLVAVVASSTACRKAPPEAPTELSELAGFLFERMWDPADESEDLELGVDNLIAWLEDNSDAASEGYTVRDLDESVIASVNPNRDPGLGPVGGASVSGEILHKVRPIARALVVDEQEDIFDNYKAHERVYFDEPESFMSKDIDRLTTDNDVETKIAGIITIFTRSRAQFRWVEKEDGPDIFLHRTWITRPATSEPDILTVNEQLYFGITIPWEGHALRLGTTWAEAEITGGIIGEDGTLQLMVDNMAKEAEILDEYLD